MVVFEILHASNYMSALFLSLQAKVIWRYCEKWDALRFVSKTSQSKTNIRDDNKTV